MFCITGIFKCFTPHEDATRASRAAAQLRPQPSATPLLCIPIPSRRTVSAFNEPIQPLALFLCLSLYHSPAFFIPIRRVSARLFAPRRACVLKFKAKEM